MQHSPSFEIQKTITRCNHHEDHQVRIAVIALHNIFNGNGPDADHKNVFKDNWVHILLHFQ